MTRVQFTTLLLAATITAFIGGLLGSWMLASNRAYADNAPQSLTVRQLDLVDSSGKLVARLGDYEDYSGLFFYDQDGKLRIDISARPKLMGPHIVMNGDDGWPSILMTASNASQTPQFIMENIKHDNGLRLEFKDNGAVDLELERAGQMRTSLSLDPAGEPSLNFFDKRGGSTKSYP